MKNKLWIPIIALLLITSVDSYGQRWKLRRYEMDMYLGITSFHGDIGLANKPFANTFNGMRPSFGLIPRFPGSIPLLPDFLEKLSIPNRIHALPKRMVPVRHELPVGS